MGVKNWLIRKTRTLVGTAPLETQLDAQRKLLSQIATKLERMDGLALLAWQNAQDVQAPSHGTHARDGASPPDGRPSLFADARKTLEQQGLFVFGCGRSGTTTLMNALNCSPDALVLSEPNFFLYQDVADFAPLFNAIHISYNNPRAKGTYLAPGLAAGGGVFGLLARLGRDFRYVGGKVAVGPGEPYADVRARYVDFHAEHFYRSRHLLIARQPAEVVLSLSKMFPTEPVGALFTAWLLAIETAVDLYRVCPNARWLFLEDLDAAMVQRAVAGLDMELDVPPGLISQDYVRTRVEGDDLPPLLAPYADLCRACSDVYFALRGGMCRELLRCRPEVIEEALFVDVLYRCGLARQLLPKKP